MILRKLKITFIHYQLHLLGQLLAIPKFRLNLELEINQHHGASSFHYGIDIAAPTSSSLVSSINGKVIYAGFNRCKWIYYKN